MGSTPGGKPESPNRARNADLIMETTRVMGTAKMQDPVNHRMTPSDREGALRSSFSFAGKETGTPPRQIPRIRLFPPSKEGEGKRVLIVENVRVNEKGE